MLSFLSLCPHPPIILPGVSSKEDRQKVLSTIEAMEKLEDSFRQSETETIILVSPHGPLDDERMSLLFTPETNSNLQSFGGKGIDLSFSGDLEINQNLVQRMESEKIPLRVLRHNKLDHGGAIPLYFLTQKGLIKPKFVELTYSALDLKMHLSLGKVIYQVAQESSQRVAFVASGDLSHRLSPTAPAGYSSQGKIFDQKILQFLKEKDLDAIITMDPALVREAGECGYRSIIILVGILKQMGLANWTPEILSYQAPFGVGYAVVNFKIHHA